MYCLLTTNVCCKRLIAADSIQLKTCITPLKLFNSWNTLENGINNLMKFRDVLDPDTGIRYPVKFRHPALSGIRYKFAGYLPDSTVRYFLQP